MLSIHSLLPQLGRTAELNLRISVLECFVDIGQVGSLHVASDGNDSVLVVVGSLALQSTQSEVLCHFLFNCWALATSKVWATDCDREGGCIDVPEGIIVAGALGSVVSERIAACGQLGSRVALRVDRYWCGQRTGSGEDRCN